MLQWRRYEITGFVQGVGFRPFVCRTALAERLTGWVQNDTRGVTVEIEGSAESCDRFIDEVRLRPPALARIGEVTLVEQAPIECPRYAAFTIASSGKEGPREALIAPDAYVCDDCLRELFDPRDRRYRYPFINCTNCGPRFSIIRDMPYDRCNTTMESFVMCAACSGEYNDVADRRFHAQPNACWSCGPQLRLVAADGSPDPAVDPVARAVELLSSSAILAVKGIGGYHIMVNPADAAAVSRLRARKRRPHKPFALMSDSVVDIGRHAVVNSHEAALLSRVERPIVIVEKRVPDAFADEVAPGQDAYGVMLASAPLHHLLLRGNFAALIATSANVTNEPIAFDDAEALVQLRDVVDFFLMHNRPIHTRVDDSILRAVELGGRPRSVVMRRARGYTPVPLELGRSVTPTLAVGAELKSTVSVTKRKAVFVSQHIGDLKNFRNYEFFVSLVEHMLSVLEIQPEVIACDLHPDLLSTRYARDSGRAPVIAVQHHHAHMAACMAENGLNEPVIGVTFDGFGFGTDGTAWGGEFLVGDYCQVQRRGHLRHFPLAGGNVAAREPYRVALALLNDALGPQSADSEAVRLLQGCGSEQVAVVLTMLRRNLNAPFSTSVGRLFDGVAALLGVRPHPTFEGQTAMELEQLAALHTDAVEPFDYGVQLDGGTWQIDHRPMIVQLASELTRGGVNRHRASRRFHFTLAASVRDVCGRLRAESGLDAVVLSGGVFLNRCLLESCHRLLLAEGFRVYTHSQVPTNDGGISVGQALVASARCSAGLA